MRESARTHGIMEKPDITASYIPWTELKDDSFHRNTIMNKKR